MALRIATSKPRDCAVKRFEICRPAASSFALLMRLPDERRSMEVLSSPVALVR
ncbi:Uncharacterised protein [Vibrio cholerae]|nr:Uncharacterised protein [Vibrio cholerae]